jgi:addiction module RelE/StbE family toxin
MLPIRWSAAALDRFDELIEHIARFNPRAAETLHDRIESSVLPLSDHPYLFRQGRVSGTRELVAHPNYIVVYRVLSDCIEITNVLHARRQYP